MEAQPQAAPMTQEQAAGVEEGHTDEPQQELAALPATQPGVAPVLPQGQPAQASTAEGGVRVVNSREEFMEAWEGFMDSRGLDSKIPLFNRTEIDLFKLYKLVLKGGGAEAVGASKKWAAIGRQFNPPSSMTDLSFQIKKIFSNKLKAMEEAYNAGELGIIIPVDGPIAEVPAPRAAKPKSGRTPPLPVQQAPIVRPLRNRLSAPIPGGALGSEALVGQRIGVYWKEDRQWYFGTVADHNEAEGTHQVAYDDGETEWLRLDDEDWGLETEILAREAGGEREAAGGSRQGAGRRRGSGAPAKKRAKAEDPAAPLLPGAAAGSGYATPSPHMLAAAAGSAEPSPAATISTPYTSDTGRAAATAAAAVGLLSGEEGFHFPPATAGGLGSQELPPIPLPPGMQPRRLSAAQVAPEQHQQALREMVLRTGAGQEMVANGSRYRAFTAATGPPGFEIFCWLPGVSIEEVHVRCWSNGRVLIRTDVQTQSQAPFQEMVQLPARLDTRTAQALLTTAGHLYVRINCKPAQEQGLQGPAQAAGAMAAAGTSAMGVMVG